MRFWRGKYFVIADELRFQGRTYSKGDEFPWRKKAIAEAAVRRLVAQGLLAADTEDGRYAPVAEEVTEVNEEEVATEETEPEETPFIYDPEIYELRIPRRGHVYITHAGEDILAVTRTEGKRLREVLEATEVDADEVR